MIDSDIGGMSGTDQLSFLTESYLIFWEFGINFDMIMRDDTAIIQYRQFVSMTAPEFTDAIRNNVQ